MMDECFWDYGYSERVRDGQTTTTEQMINDICNFRQIFHENKENEGVANAMKKLELLYFVNIQTEQNVGIHEIEEIEAIIRQIDDLDAQEANSDAQSTRSERFIKQMYESTGPKRRLELETINLYRGYKSLKQPPQSLSETEKKSFGRLLDVPRVAGLHEMLMDEEPYFVDFLNCKPGELTTEERWTNLTFGEKVYYPKFNTKTEVEMAMDGWLTSYNRAILDIMNIQTTKHKIEAVFKCAAKVLFWLSTIRAFPDGNGRTARLACYYCLGLISPFPTPVYNVCSPSTRKEFGESLVEAKSLVEAESLMEARGDGSKDDDTLQKLMAKCLKAKPSKLCAILIEANWYMWKRFLSDLKIQA